MSAVIIFTNENGNVSVCVPTGELSVQEVQAKDIPAGIKSFIVQASSLPQNDVDFFDAWEQNNGIITVNLQKAKEITKLRLRAEREPLFQAQDVAFQRALENGLDTAAIVLEKTRLRDLTKLADAAQSLDELRSIKAKAA